MAEADSWEPLDLPRSLSAGGWAIADQGTFAAANFVLNVLLARWLAEDAYGSFTIAFTVFLLAGTLYTALVIEPMLVFGPGRFRTRMRRYFLRLTQTHVLVSVAFGLLLALAGGAFVSRDLQATGDPLLVLGLCTPILLLQWFARRSVYVVTRPDIGAMGGFIYLASVVAGLMVLQRRQLLDPISAIWLMTGASALASAAIALGLWYVLPTSSSKAEGHPSFRVVLDAHWEYGRWALATALLTWLPGNIYFLVLPVWAGLEATATLRALMNLYLPMMHASVALGILAIPIFVRWRGQKDFMVRLRRIALWLVLAGVAYSVAIGFAGKELVAWLYAGRYGDDAPLAWLLGLLPAAAAAAAIFGAGLRALEQPDRVFFAYVGGAGFTLTAGLAAAAFFSVPGASVGWSLSYSVTAFLLYRILSRATRRIGGAV